MSQSPNPYDLKPECGQRLHPGPIEFWCGKLTQWFPAAGLECKRCKAGLPVTTEAYRASLNAISVNTVNAVNHVRPGGPHT